MEKQKVTIYTTSEMFGSVVKREGYLIEHGRKPYAQYKDAPFVIYIPKGKRSPVGFCKGYKPYLIICKGWNCPDSPGMFGESKTENGITIKKSLYSSFDDRYKSDFNKILKESNIDIIADYREVIV